MCRFSHKKIGLCAVKLNTNTGSSASESDAAFSVVSRNGNAFELELDSRYHTSLLSPSWIGWAFTGWYDADGKELNCANLKETTYYARWVDVTPPAVSVASTNNVASSQTVTMKMSDGQSGIAGYYCGTANPETTAVTYTAFTGSETTYQVSADGTYYFSAKDATGNVTTKTLTFHKLTLNGNGGTCTPGYLIGLKGNNISLPAATRTGYTYQGWAETNNATTGSSAAQFTANRTLYAVWKVNYYTLNFNVNASGASCSPASKSVAYGSGYGSLPTPMKPYCTFTGWFTDPSGGSQVSATTTMGAGDTTVYAHWTPNNYTLSFNANGGSCTTGSKVVTYGSAYGDLPTPTRDYYTFNGWFTAASGDTQVSTSTIMSGGDTTVYAQWTVKSYTLTFNTNGSKSSCSESSRSVAYGAKYGTLPTPTRTGWDFVGWFTKASGGTQVTKDTTMGGSNTTVYAHWKSIPGLESTNHTSVTVTLPACSDWKTCQPSITIQVKTSSGWENFASYGLASDVLSTALTYTFTGLDINKTYRVATTGNSASGWWRGADAGAYTRCKMTQCPHGANADCNITCKWN